MDVLNTAILIVIVSMTLFFMSISLFIFFKGRRRKRAGLIYWQVRYLLWANQYRKRYETRQSRFEEIRKTLDSVDRDPTSGIG